MKMERSDREQLETWMSAFIDGELDFEASSLLLEALHEDAAFRAEMLIFLKQQKAVRQAIENSLRGLSSQEQADMVVDFWHQIEADAQESHEEEFLQERAYLLAQNVLQGRLQREALETIAQRDPACVREAAKIIGQMESVRNDLETQAVKEPLDELRHSTMTQLFGSAEVVEEPNVMFDETFVTDTREVITEEEIISERNITSEPHDASEQDVEELVIPPVPLPEDIQKNIDPATAANDDGIEASEPQTDLEDDDDFVLVTPGAKVIQLFKKVKVPAVATAVAAAVGLFILPAGEPETPPAPESSSEVFAALMPEEGAKADPQWQDRLLAAWQMELDQSHETSAEALPILNDNSLTDVESLDTRSSNPMVFKTPNKNITVIWIGEQQG